MDNIDVQITLAKLETTLSALTQAFNTRMDTFEEKMATRFENIIEKMDAQKADHDKDIGRVSEMNDQAVNGLTNEIQDLKKRIQTLEEAPAQRALEHANSFRSTVRDFVYKACAIGLIGVVLLLVGSVVFKGKELTPQASELIKKATGGE